MPYIELKDRLAFEQILNDFGNLISNRGISRGELNFLFTKLSLMYIEKHGKSYSTLADIIGTFECAKMEFYRKSVVPYEEKKIKQNGDV